jgi:hypothetical protein
MPASQPPSLSPTHLLTQRIDASQPSLPSRPSHPPPPPLAPPPSPSQVFPSEESCCWGAFKKQCRNLTESVTPCYVSGPCRPPFSRPLSSSSVVDASHLSHTHTPPHSSCCLSSPSHLLPPRWSTPTTRQSSAATPPRSAARRPTRLVCSPGPPWRSAAPLALEPSPTAAARRPRQRLAG